LAKIISTKTILGLGEGHFDEDNLDEDYFWTGRRPFRRREMSTKTIFGLDEGHVGEDNVDEDHS